MEDEDSRLKYRQVEKEIRRLIDESGEGARLPSERKLANLLGISFMTVRKGLQVLVDEGKIERKAGSGTFVLEQKKKRASSAVGPLEEQKLGLIVFRESDAFAHRLLHAFDDVSLEKHLTLRHAWISEPGKAAAFRIQKLAEEGVQALIFPWIPPAYTSGEGAVQLRKLIEESPIPVVMAPMIAGLEQHCCLSPGLYGADLISSTETLCAYFSFLGHQRIALLGPDDTENLLFQKRIVGYTYFTSRAGLDCVVGMISMEDPELETLTQNWRKYKGALAVVSYDDAYALKFMQFMGKLGLRAPEDFSIIGFNDTEESRRADPPLTTIMPNYKAAADHLMQSGLVVAQGGPAQLKGDVPSPLTFIVRESCGGRDKVERIVREMGDKLNIVLDH